MSKLLSIVILILSLLLFPPATLALISNNAVPGDATYPIKRRLEDIIYAFVSLNPTTKAWFSAARSDRRFQELSTLIAQGKSASNTLDELVIQTDIAAEEIKKVEDPVRKQELIAQLSQSIDKYSQKLDEVVATPTQIATPKVSPTKPTAVSTVSPTQTPNPTPTTTPSPTPTQTSPKLPLDQKDLEDAKEKLEDIKDKLKKEEKKFHQEKREDKREDRQDDEKEKDKQKTNKDSDHDKKQD